MKSPVDSEVYIVTVSKTLIAGLGDGDDLIGCLNLLGQFVAYINHGPSSVGGAVLEPARTEDVMTAFGVLVRALWPQHAQNEAKATFKAISRLYDTEPRHRRFEFHSHMRKVVARYLHFLVYNHTKVLPQTMIGSIERCGRRRTARSKGTGPRRFSFNLEALLLEFGRFKNEPDSLSGLIGDTFFEIKRGGRFFFESNGLQGPKFSRKRREVCRRSHENAISRTLNALIKTDLEVFRYIFSPSVLVEGLLVEGLGGGDLGVVDQLLQVQQVDLKYIRDSSWMKVKINKVLFDAAFTGIWDSAKIKWCRNWAELHFFEFLGLASAACLTGDHRWREYRHFCHNMVVQLRRSGSWILDNRGPQAGGGLDSYNFVHTINEFSLDLTKSIPDARILFWFDPQKIKWADPRYREKFRRMKSETLLSYEAMRARMKGASCKGMV